MIYLITFLGSIALLSVLKLFEGSPVRSWKAVVLIGLLLSGAAGWYFTHAMPAKAVPVPHAQKASAYRAELERTYRRIAGVDSASIEGSVVRINFAEDKPLPELKRIALECGGTAAYFLRTDDKNAKLTIHLTVRGADRYEMDFDPSGRVANETVY